MALQQDFIVKNGLVVRNTATIANLDKFVGTSTTVIPSQPTLNLNFASVGKLDSRITFLRASLGSYVGSDGYIKYAAPNQPRIEYSSTQTGVALGLLMEEQRTNITLYSNNVGNTYSWVFQYGAAGEAAYVLNGGIAPDGTQSATLLYATTSSLTYPNFFSYITVNTATTYTTSYFVKPVNGKTVTSYSVYDGATNLNTLYFGYDFSTGVFNTSTVGTTCTFILNPTIQQYPNGWYRIQASYSFNSGPARLIQSKMNLDSSGVVTPGAGLLFWGAQLETGVFASSIIPTQTASATRVRDYAEMTGNNFYPWFNPTIGTWYAEFDTLWTTQSTTANQTVDLMDAGVLAINDSAYVGGATGYNGGAIVIRTNTTAAPIRYITRSGKSVSISGTADFNLGRYVTRNTPFKAVATYRPQILSIVTEGRPVVAAPDDVTVAGAKLVYNRLDIGYQRVGGSPAQLNGHIKTIKYWPYILSTAQQSALTSNTNYVSSPGANLSPRIPYTANTSDFVVQTGVVVKEELEVPDVDKYYVTTQTTPSIAPSLNLNFLRPVLDPRITFTRGSVASYIGPDGYIKYAAPDVARFDYSQTSTGTCLGLLMEEQRTNFLLNFGATNGCIRSVSSAIGPDGQPATAVTVNASTSTLFPYFGFGAAQSFTAGSSVDVAFTGYFGPSFGTQQLEPHIVVSFSNGVATTYNEVQINMATWTVRSNALSSTITQVIAPTITRVPSGMYKISFVVRYTDDGSLRNSISSYVQIRDTGGQGVYVTDGTAGFSYACCQAEVGSFPTSYIPTTSAAVTRIVDFANIYGSKFDKWYNNTQGTLYIEADSSFINENTSAGALFRWPISIAKDNGEQHIGFWKGPNNNYVRVKMTDAAGTSRFELTIGGAISTGTAFKAAVAYQNGDQFAIMNAVSSQTGVSNLLPSPVGRFLRIGNGDYYWNGHIRRILYYPVRLNNTQTQALTVL